MNEELISVLMVNYNRENTIRDAVQSVLNQTWKNLQLIIVDDGSTDRSCEIVEDFSDSRIEMYRLEKNEHICYATNFGFDKVRGKYLARIDSDDIWYENRLDRQMQFMKKNPECRICFTWCNWINERGEIINDEEPELRKMCDADFRSQRDWIKQFYYVGNCLLHSSVLMETELMRETGGFEPAYRQLHDYDYWVRIVKHHNLYVIPERLIGMRRFGKENDKNINASAVTEENDIRTFNEYADIRAHIFDDMPEDVFLAAFQDDFICKASVTPQELECEKAFILCKSQIGWEWTAPAGIEKLKELFRDDEMKDILEKKFNFSIKDLYRMNAKNIYFDPIVQKKFQTVREERDRLEVDNKSLYDEVERLKKEISLYRDSTSWKVTRPLRRIRKIVRRK